MKFLLKFLLLEVFIALASWPSHYLAVMASLQSEEAPGGSNLMESVKPDSPLRFSIITPSFRNSDWLKLCIASVADQGMPVEHIIQDAGSDDGTLDWLPKDPRVKAFVERDDGMYDAVNRGLRRAQGGILAYLNCDEQYLPGALAAVAGFFRQNPRVDVLFADFVVVDGGGNYLFHRKVQRPLKYHTWVSHLPAFTCATFFRRSLIAEHQLFFDPNLRVVGDAEWMVRLLRRGTSMAVLRRFTSTFAMTGANLSAKPNARWEARELFNSAPLWTRKLKGLLVLHHRLRRLAAGFIFRNPSRMRSIPGRMLRPNGWFTKSHSQRSNGNPMLMPAIFDERRRQTRTLRPPKSWHLDRRQGVPAAPSVL